MVRSRSSWRPLIQGYTVRLVLAGGLYFILSSVWGRLMPIQLGAFLHGGLDVNGLRSVWFMFAWVGIASAFYIATKRSEPYGLQRRWSDIGRVLMASSLVGVVEEIIYRGFVFFSMMVVSTFLNIVTFGFVQWCYTHASPIVNALTLHALGPELLDTNWIVGAAILSANAIFSSAHARAGNTFKAKVVAVANAWFCGLVFFYLAFNCGLLTAIVAHVLYDALMLSVIVMAYGKEGLVYQWFYPKHYQSRYG